jgi:hypothetical protein
VAQVGEDDGVGERGVEELARPNIVWLFVNFFAFVE